MYPIIYYNSLAQRICLEGIQTVANEILIQFSENKVPFPLGNYFIDKDLAMEKMELLKRYEGVLKNNRYSVRTDEISFGFRCMPLFQGKPLMFIPTENEYREIDNLTCAFTDNSRLASYRMVPNKETLSPLDGWSRYGDYVFGAIIHCLERKSDISAFNLREALYFTSKSIDCPYTECAHERLTFIKTVIIYLKGLLPPDLELRIFDTCAGWGDRLIVAIALEAGEYIGVEPNMASQEGFQKAIEMFAPEDMRDRYRVICDGCPNVGLPSHCIDGHFSMVFLSPPAFNSEYYSDDPHQSIKMFSNFDDWILGFLLPTVELAWAKLAIGGFLIIQSLLAAKINTFAFYLLKGSYYMGAISIRTGRNRNKPLWIWRKTNAVYKKKLDYRALEMAFGKNVLDNYLRNQKSSFFG